MALGAAAAPPRSLWSDAWLRLRRNRMAVAAGGFLLVMSTLAALAPWLPGLADPTLQDLGSAHASSLAHAFGTDELVAATVRARSTAGVSRSWSGSSARSSRC